MASQKPQRQTPVGKVRVKVLPKDPKVALENDLWPVEIVLDCPTPGDGPTSARVAVIDYNADLDTTFAPARLLADRSGYRGIKSSKNPKILEDFNFHQVNVWALVEQTLGWLEDEYALARPIPWASGLGRLLILPHAGYAENAFYDRSTGALHFFYFQGREGNQVFTCLSHDIVTHELGHAVLDGLKPGYNEVCSPETAGFHEYFGDAMAMTASLRSRETAKLVTEGAPEKLRARNVVSAIASEFGAALSGVDQDYLRGAWNQRTMADLRGTYEEHDWSEVLTGVYYELLQYLYKQKVARLKKERRDDWASGLGQRQHLAMQALFNAAEKTSSVMLRALDYCPPVDLRYDEYARALLRADEVAYPLDDDGIRTELGRIFRKRGLNPPKEDAAERSNIVWALRRVADIEAIAATPADAYRFIDQHRELFHIPHDANLCVPSVYRTRKLAKNGYRPPRERILEFTWSEDVKLEGKRFGQLAGTFLPLPCGGTLVFDSNGNFLHLSLVLPSAARRRELLRYARYLVRSGSLGMVDRRPGIGAPGTEGFRIRAVVDGNRVHLERNAAMRHSWPGKEHDRE
jgi:hypothetical protein